MIERKEIERVDRLIRFRELKVSIVTVSVGSRRERNNLFLQLSLSFLSVFLLIYSLSLTFISLPFLRPKSQTQL